MIPKSEHFVSIIVNCYNGEKYLTDCLQSIVNQTYKNWELIFWDVSSSNKCLKIVESFKEEKINYYNTGKKKNLYASRNDAIKKSNGDILAFLDCDDWWEPEKLEKQISYFKDEHVSMVYSNYYEHYEKSSYVRKISDKKIYSGFIQDKIIYDYHIGILTTLIRKKIFNDLGGYNNFFHIIGDFEFNVRLSEKNKIIGLKEPLAHYRIHNENVSKDLDKEILELEECLKIFVNFGFKNKSKFESYLNFKKCYNSIKKKRLNLIIKYFLKIDFSLLKLKIVFIFFKNYLGV